MTKESDRSFPVRESYINFERYLVQLETQFCNIHYNSTSVAFVSSKAKPKKKMKFLQHK